ncbi:MAG: flagellar hook-length control protein FliK [Phycisphaerales bacterium JB039]
MVHSVHSQFAQLPQQGAQARPAAHAAFEPALLMALLTPAPMDSLLAPAGPADRAADALAGGPARRSASAHWAQEAMARATGQQFGVDLAELASDQLAAPGPRIPGAESHAAARPAPAAPGAPLQQQPRSGRDQPAAQDPPRQAETGADTRPSPTPRDGSASPQTPGPDARGAPAQANAGGGGASPGPAAPVAAPTPQAPGAAAPAAPASAPALRIESAQRAAPARPATPAATAARTMQTQIERGLGAVLRQGGGSLTLQLKPATLGELRIEMTLDKGAVRARFEASSPESRDLILANLGALKAALESRGLRVETLDVTAPDAPERAAPAAPTRPAETGQTPQQHQAGHDGAGPGHQDDGARHQGREPAPSQQQPQPPEDPAFPQSAGDASETLVMLRLDTVA